MPVGDTFAVPVDCVSGSEEGMLVTCEVVDIRSAVDTAVVLGVALSAPVTV